MDRRSRDESMNDNSEQTGDKKRTYGGVFNKFADITSMSGVGYIKNSKLIIAKMIWSFLLLTSVVALGVHLWYSLSQFYSYPKTAKISLGFANLRLPDITICNINPVSKRLLDSYNSSTVDNLKRLVEALHPEMLAPEQFDDSLSFDDIAELYWDSYASDYHYEDLWHDHDGGFYEYLNFDNYDDYYDYYYNYYNFYDYYNDYYKDYYDVSGSESGDSYDESLHAGESGSGSGDSNDTLENEDGSGSNTEKEQKTTYEEIYDKFNFTDFDPAFEEWFRRDRGKGHVDNHAKVNALFRRTFMKLSRWERLRLGHNITKMLMKCTFAGRKCEKIKDNFRIHQTPEYGNCWTLSGLQFLAKDSGPNAGLSMVINLQTKDYLDGITHGHGARIQIHNYGAYPDPYQDGFSVPAAMETSIALKQVSFKRLSGNYGDCEDGVEFARKYKRPYSRRTCQIFCHSLRLTETCGCYDDFSEEVAVKTGHIQNLYACNTTEQYDCLHRIHTAFAKKELTCYCRNPCKERDFTTSVTSHQWPTANYAKLLQRGICSEDYEACKSFEDDANPVVNNFLKLNLYYEDLNFEEITEEPDIEIAQILSDVGGAVGLWIGLSVMSFCEVIQLIIELIKLTPHKIRERKTTEGNP